MKGITRNPCYELFALILLILLVSKKLNRQFIGFEINPDYIVVCDFGYKGFLAPFLIKRNCPMFFEAHGSLFNESQLLKNNFIIRTGQKLKYLLRSYCAKKFDAFIVLSNESLKEWNVKTSCILPNPNWIESPFYSKLNSKKVIVLARHSYEKGLDRLLRIWKVVSANNPDWILEIYGTKSSKIDLSPVEKV